MLPLKIKNLTSNLKNPEKSFIPSVLLTTDPVVLLLVPKLYNLVICPVQHPPIMAENTDESLLKKTEVYACFMP